MSLGEDWQKNIRNVTLRTPRSNEQKGINGIEGGGFDKHDGDGFGGLLQATGIGRSPHRLSNAYDVQGEPYDDHKREEDIE